MRTYSNISAASLRFFKEHNLLLPCMESLKYIYNKTQDSLSKYACDKGMLTPYIINYMVTNAGYKPLVLDIQQRHNLDTFCKSFKLAYDICQKRIIREFLESNSPLLEQFTLNLRYYAFSWHNMHNIDEYLNWIERNRAIQSFFSNSFSWAGSPEGFDFWQEKSEMLQNCEKFW